MTELEAAISSGKWCDGDSVEKSPEEIKYVEMKRFQHKHLIYYWAYFQGKKYDRSRKQPIHIRRSR
jgi:hypothetical protein